MIVKLNVNKELTPAQKTKNKFDKDTITPKMAYTMLTCLTDSILVSTDAMYASYELDGYYGSLCVASICHHNNAGIKRVSRYRILDICILRDCLSILGNLEYNTSVMQLNKNYLEHRLFLEKRPSAHELNRVSAIVGEHLDHAGYCLAIRGGGLFIQRKQQKNEGDAQ